MNELLNLINELLVFVFTIIETFLSAYYFLIILFVGIAVAVAALFYIANMARTHIQ